MRTERSGGVGTGIVGAASGVRLAELAASFSLASDIALGQPMEHALRTCLLAVSLGEASGLDEPASVAQ